MGTYARNNICMPFVNTSTSVNIGRDSQKTEFSYVICKQKMIFTVCQNHVASVL
jgi:hypothetical protein